MIRVASSISSSSRTDVAHASRSCCNTALSTSTPLTSIVVCGPASIMYTRLTTSPLISRLAVDLSREAAVPMVEILESIAIVLPPGEIERVARAKFEERSNPIFREGEIAADLHIRNVLTRLAAPWRFLKTSQWCRCRTTFVMPEPVRQEVLVIRYEPQIDRRVGQYSTIQVCASESRRLCENVTSTF